jgi:hypothetical protein
MARGLPLVVGLGLDAAFPPRGRSRLLMRSTAVALVTAFGATTAVTVFVASMNHLVDHPRLHGWAWDVLVTCDQGYCPLNPGATTAGLDAIEGVDAWSFVTFAPVALEGSEVPGLVYSPGQGEHAPLTITAGRAPASAGEVALGTETMARLGRSVGDTVIAGPNGDLTLEIVGRAVFAGIGRADEPRASLGEGAAISAESRAAAVVDLDLPNGDVRRNAVLVSVDGPHVAAEIARAFPTRDVTTGATPGDLRAWRELRPLVVTLVVVLLVLAAGSVLHAMTLSARLRRDDFALLRALGLRARQTAAVLGWQAGALFVLTSAAALLGGLVIGRLVWSSTEQRLDLLAPTRLALAAAVSMGLVLVVAAAAALAGSLVASRHVRSSPRPVGRALRSGVVASPNE